MALALKDTLDLAQAIATVATPITILLTLRQLKLGREQIKKQSDNTAVNFVLNAEGQFDGMHEQALTAPIEVIKVAYGPEIDPSWTETDIRSFVYLRRLYGHVSRMVYIVNDTTVDVGMDDEDRKDFILAWERMLMKYVDHPIMLHVHKNAMRFQDYNTHMLALSQRVFGSSASATRGEAE